MSSLDVLFSPDELSDELLTLLLNEFPALCDEILPIVDEIVKVDTEVTDVSVEIIFDVINVFCVVWVFPLYSPQGSEAVDCKTFIQALNEPSSNSVFVKLRD